MVVDNNEKETSQLQLPSQLSLLACLSRCRELLDGGAERVVRLLALAAVAAVREAAPLVVIVTWPAFRHTHAVQPLSWCACVCACAREELRKHRRYQLDPLVP